MNLLNPKSFERADEGRRRLVRLGALATLFSARPGAWAGELARTPAQTEGPFFPDRLPLDTDNDLLAIGDASTFADGEPTWFSGRVLDAAGGPVRGALVEIWQCDAHGAYLHSGSGNAERRDGRFQGYGRFVTGLAGTWGFRTIKPVPYPGRSPHIHVKVTRGGTHLLTTQCYVKGHPGNGRDGIFRGLSPEQAAAVVADFVPVEGSRIGELAASWDIVLGLTPADG